MESTSQRGYELIERRSSGTGAVDLAKYSSGLLSIAQAVESGDACIAASRLCAQLSDSGRAAVVLREGPLNWHVVAGENIADLPEYLTAADDTEPFLFRAGEIVRISDVAEYAKTHPQANGMVAAGIRSFIAGALQYGDHDGYLAVYNESRVEYSNEDITLLSLVALQLSLTLTSNSEAQSLRKAAEAVPQPVWTADANGATDYCNRRWCDYTGLTVDETTGFGWQEVVHPDDRERCLRRWKDAMLRGDLFEVEFRLRRANDHAFRWFLARALPLKDPSGKVTKWFATCTEIDDQKRANDSMHFLLEVSEVLASSSEIQTTLQKLADLAVPRIADWCLVYLASNNGNLYRAALAHDDPVALKAANAIIEEYPILRAGHIQQAFEGEQPLLIPLIDETVVRQNVSDERQFKLVRALRARSAMLLPLRARGRTYGALVFVSGKSGRVFGETDLPLAKLVAKRAAVAVDNARLFEQERQSAARLQFLADAGKALTASLDLRKTLETLLDLIVPSVADWAGINLVQDDGSTKITALKHRDPALAGVVDRLRGEMVATSEVSTGTAAPWRSGRTEIYRQLSAHDMVRITDPQMLPAVEQLGYRSMAVIPLRARGRSLGSLAAVWTGRQKGRDLDMNDLPMLEQLAARAASAIEHAQLYEHQHHVADTLQRAFLPANFPDAPGVAFDAVYSAGQSESEIGGDWYDAFELHDGRIFISMGDVAGRGLPAAVTMGKMRQALRSFALAHSQLTEVLTAANNSLRLEDPDAMVTIFVGIVDRNTQSLTYAIAGHPRPFLRLSDGSISELSGDGIPLGIRGQLKVGVYTIAFPLEAMLVCYTDGLTENTRDIFESEKRLREALADKATAMSDHPAVALMNAVVAKDHSDDVAVLTVSMRRTFPGSLNLAFPAVAVSSQKVRHALRAFVRELEVSEEKDFEIQVAVGEAVNNVIEHAYGAAEGNVWVNAQSSDGKLVVEVSDRGNWRMPRQDHGGRGLHIIESLCESLVVHSGKDRSFVRLTFDLTP